MMKKQICLFCLFIILSVLSGCGDKKQRIFSRLEQGKEYPATVQILYPENGTVFPPDIVAPTVRWEESNSQISEWLVMFEADEPINSTRVRSKQWKVGAALWNRVTSARQGEDISIRILGIKGSRILSSAAVTIHMSDDSVGAPVFYRAVPLPFEYALKNLELIRWQMADLSSTDPPKIMLQNLPLCGNCHSFTPDGKTLGMDVDYANDKGSYIISDISEETVFTPEKIITWSDYRRKDGKNTFGLLSQISPDGRYVVSTVKDRSIFVPVDNLNYSQLFFPIKGILAVYDRVQKTFHALPGADDPDLVQSNPAWSPNGQVIYFARNRAYHSKAAESSNKAVLPTSAAEEFLSGKVGFQYDIYRIPFNDGKGGRAVPVKGASQNGKSNFFPKISPNGKWIVFTQAANFMLLQPDSRLYIMPADGGEPRLMTCNRESMNSWHSWSPNGKWLVFSSKINGAYTELWMTHIDEYGQDSPPVCLEALHMDDRAVNIPEFINLKADAWQSITDAFTDQSHYYFTIGRHQMGEGKYREAIGTLSRAIQLDPNDDILYVYKGHAQFAIEDYPGAIESYKQAIRLKTDESDVYVNAGTAYFKLKQYKTAIGYYSKAIELNPRHAYAYFSRGSSKAKLGDLDGAVKDYSKCIDIGGRTDEVYYERGLARALLKNYTGAQEDFLLAAEANPDNLQTLEKLAGIYYQLKNYRAAIQSYGQLISRQETARYYSYRGACKIGLRDYQGALEDYESALRLNPLSGVDICQRGLMKIRLGLKAAGCQDLQHALSLGFKPAAGEIKKHCQN